MIKRALGISLVVSAQLLLSACGGGSTMFREDAAHSGVSQMEGPIKLDRLAWKFSAPDKIYASPVVSGDTIYIGCKDGNLYALDLEKGNVKWKFKTGGNIEAAVAVQGDTVYVGSWDNYLYAIDTSTHQQKWKFRTEGIVYSAPTVDAGTVYFGSKDNHR